MLRASLKRWYILLKFSHMWQWGQKGVCPSPQILVWGGNSWDQLYPSTDGPHCWPKKQWHTDYPSTSSHAPANALYSFIPFIFSQETCNKYCPESQCSGDRSEWQDKMNHLVGTDCTEPAVQWSWSLYLTFIPLSSVKQATEVYIASEVLQSEMFECAEGRRSSPGQSWKKVDTRVEKYSERMNQIDQGRGRNVDQIFKMWVWHAA